ncbi:hypothetical protein P153DRAFT_392999 [Dothidotthia symphoricarpi CBS 119687]|uniref:Rhodopsin domain-containing protein n=1 Tax=Dothidotthia symphoricarpi CBS 119687 TaxID=1392245 RepID=A0A6A6ANN5_9PLEO|nr:uncharacterized protein P153DRAFT_392999 [Dothidotthia symphoricarpi CBS 119687]KAF2133146.1 hypothetical protein P153DRAFT_392999 [Dothidotthia symphoricarpi CBS 119687]
MSVNILNNFGVEYAIGTCIFVLRWFSRWKTAGFKHFGWEEFFALSAWFFFSLGFAIREYSLSILNPQHTLSLWTRQPIPQETKSVLASSFFTTFSFWSLKGCLVLHFLRLDSANPDTTSLPLTTPPAEGISPLRRYVQFVAGLSVLACVVCIVAQLAYCLPLNRHGQIQSDSKEQCTPSMGVNMFVTTSNVLTDALLLVVPLLALFDMRISMRQRIKIGFLVSLGLAVMVIALGQGALVAGGIESISTTWVWTQREAIIAIFTVNAPVINELLDDALLPNTGSPYGCLCGWRYAPEKALIPTDSNPWSIHVTRHETFTVVEADTDSEPADASWVVSKSKTTVPFRISWRNIVQGGHNAERIL